VTWSCPAPPESLWIEKASREEIGRLQDEQLRELVHRAWEHIPFYRERWQRAGVHPGEIAGVKDIRKLPIVRKSDFEDSLRLHPPFGDYQGDFAPVRVQASSGTSGNPKPFFFTRNDWDTIARLWARRFYAQGVREGDVLQVVFAYTLFIVGFSASEGAMRLGALVVPTGSGGVTPSERQVRIARDWGVSVLAGTPSYVLHLADVAEQQGYHLHKDFRLRRTIHTAEAMTESARHAIEGRWGVEAFDNFGSVETGAPSFECEMKDGCHVNEDAYIFEVLDPDTYDPVPPGDQGVLVVTCLFKEAAPVIRYNIEDLCSFIDEPCVCGRSFRRISKLRGRTSDMLKVSGIPFYPTSVETALEHFPELTREYIVIVERVGQQDRLSVQVERRPGCDAASDLKSQLERELKIATNLTIEALLLAPGELAKSLRVENRIKVKRLLDKR
jgi:phenylacetate-CoA ligase